MRYKRQIRKYFLIFVFGLILAIVLKYHEKILNFFDSIFLPINDEICKHLPSSIRENLRNFKIIHNTINQEINSLKYKVAIVIPYRNREENLKLFLLYMHPFLRNQNLTYEIFLIEPAKDLLFNRALLLNIGFRESLKLNKLWNCFIFHDIDLLPENLLNLYQCHDEVPKQMVITVSNYNYT